MRRAPDATNRPAPGDHNAAARRIFGSGDGAICLPGRGKSATAPKGILTYPCQPAATAGFGQIGTIATGTAGGFDATAPADALMDLVHSLGSKYRRNGKFPMNRLTSSAVRRLKSADGEYLWQPRLGEALESSLLGFPMNGMRRHAGNCARRSSDSLRRFHPRLPSCRPTGHLDLARSLFGQPYLLFYATKRVGGAIRDFNALRLLTFSATKSDGNPRPVNPVVDCNEI